MLVSFAGGIFGGRRQSILLIKFNLELFEVLNFIAKKLVGFEIVMIKYLNNVCLT